MMLKGSLALVNIIYKTDDVDDGAYTLHDAFHLLALYLMLLVLIQTLVGGV